MLDYVEANQYILNCVYDSIGREEMKRFFCSDFLEIVASIIDQAERAVGKTLDEGYREFLSHFYLEAMAGMLIDWIKTRDRADRDTVVGDITNTIRESLTAVVMSAGK